MAIAVCDLEGNAWVYLVRWSVIISTFSLFVLLGSICKLVQMNELNGWVVSTLTR